MYSEVSFKTNTVAIIFQLYTETASSTIQYYVEKLSALQFKKKHIELLDIKKYLLQLSNIPCLRRRLIPQCTLIHAQNPQNLCS